MAYSDKVLDHYENPRNVGSFDKDDKHVGTGMVGAPACGDVMKLQIKVDDNNIITDACFKTYGCGSAIASSKFIFFIYSVAYDELAIADPHPNVLNLASSIIFVKGLTLI